MNCRTNVYRIDPQSGQATVWLAILKNQTVSVFSPDEANSTIVDTGVSHKENGPAHIRVFDVADGHLSNDKVFVDMKPGMADGIRADADGNIWSSAGWGG